MPGRGGPAREPVHPGQRLRRHPRGDAGVRGRRVHYPGTYVAGCYNRLDRRRGRPPRREREPGQPAQLAGHGPADRRRRLAGPGRRRGRWSTGSSSTCARACSCGTPGCATPPGGPRGSSSAGWCPWTCPTSPRWRPSVTAEDWSGRLDGALGPGRHRAQRRGRPLPRASAGRTSCRSASQLPRRGVGPARRGDEPVRDPGRRGGADAGHARREGPARRGSSSRAAGWVGHDIPRRAAGRARTVTLEKVVAIYTSRDRAISEPAAAAVQELRGLDGFDGLRTRHAQAWERLWQHWRVELPEHEAALRVLRLHLFHLLQTVSPHTGRPRRRRARARACTARPTAATSSGTSCSCCRCSTCGCPSSARALLRYRSRRLPAARRAASAAGLRGAMFPWQSGSDGREESQRLHLNPRSGRWLPDHSRCSGTSTSPSPTTSGSTTRPPATCELPRPPTAPRCSWRSRGSWPTSPCYDPATGRYAHPRRRGAGRVPHRLPGRAETGARQQRLHQRHDGLGAAAGAGGARARCRRAGARSCSRRCGSRPRDVRAVARHHPPDDRAVPRGRGHQPVRGLRAARRARLGRLPRPVRRPAAPRPHPGGGGRLRRTGTRCPSRPTCSCSSTCSPPTSCASCCRRLGYSLAPEAIPRDHRLLPGAHLPRLDAQRRRARVGARPRPP